MGVMAGSNLSIDPFHCIKVKLYLLNKQGRFQLLFQLEGNQITCLVLAI